MMKRTIILLILSLAVIGACTTSINQRSQENSSSIQDTKTDMDQKLTGEIKKFASAAEIKQFLEQRNQEAYGIRRFFGAGEGLMESRIFAGAPMALSGKDDEASGTDDYSATNIQVEGVDEADFIKNDGRYIYLLSQKDLVIVDAYPAEKAKIIAKTEIEGNPAQLFINDDRLVVFTRDYEEITVFPRYIPVPVPRNTQKTHALIFDIADRNNPELIEDFAIPGNYYASRMLGDYVYFIVKDNAYYFDQYINIPELMANGETILKPDVFYFDHPQNSYSFHTIASFNIKDIEDINAKSFLMGYSNALYVSKDNIYIAYQNQYLYRYSEEYNKELFYKVMLPLLPKSTGEQIKEVLAEELPTYDEWDRITIILESTYNTMDEDAKEELINEIEKAANEYEHKREQEQRKSIIHRIAIDNGKIEYLKRGEVPGYLLNQFSLDEDKGYLRVATTTYLYNDGATMFNNVYVLDDQMQIIGKIEELAPNERIYSTRFISDRLYMVTYKRVDPLFVVSLSNPNKPRVLGELKIPGFSDYLHPYDKDHIIGIGKETEGNQWGGVSVKGVKLALFDVSDVTKPQLVDMVEIGEPGTDSEALRDHKAFLFDREKNLLVIPIREVEGERTFDSRFGYRQNVWQGAYIFTLTNKGFEEKGRVSHYDGEEEAGWYWRSPWAVQRSLYMDDVLYTVSLKKIVMNDLDNLDQVNEINLPYRIPEYYRGPMTLPVPVMAESR